MVGGGEQPGTLLLQSLGLPFGIRRLSRRQGSGCSKPGITIRLFRLTMVRLDTASLRAQQSNPAGGPGLPRRRGRLAMTAEHHNVITRFFGVPILLKSGH